MKKILLTSITILSIFFITISCSNSDDSSQNDEQEVVEEEEEMELVCKQCEANIGDFTINIEYCDNGDGTVRKRTEAIDGTIQEEEVDLSGLTFEEFITLQEEDSTLTCQD